MNETPETLRTTLEHLEHPIGARDLERLLDHIPAWEADRARAETLEKSLEEMVWQFGYRGDGETPTLGTGGLSALEDAFATLGRDDPHPVGRNVLCEAAGCFRWATAGSPTPNGYRRLCSTHYAALAAEEET